MLSKKIRASTQQVVLAIKKGVTKHSENFSVRSFKKDSPTTVAVVVSKKVATTAVARNKLKRKMKNILRNMILPKNKTLVIYLKKGAPSLSILDTQTELQNLL